VPRPAQVEFVGEVGLVEDILPVGLVVVRRQLDLGAGRVHGAAGKDVLVEFFVVGVARGVSDVEPGIRVVVDDDHPDMRIDQRIVQIRIAEECRRVGLVGQAGAGL
jgi:hypothetical protein